MGQITYADKSAINVNPDVADTNKVNAADMNEIKTAVNDNDSRITAIETGNYYSTNEVKTDKKWINNKPIYRKVIYVQNSTSVYNTGTFSANISNGEMVWIVNAWYQNPGTTATIPMNFNLGGTNYLRINVNNTTNGTIQIQASSNFTSNTQRNVYIIIEYTKTTD